MVKHMKKNILLRGIHKKLNRIVDLHYVDIKIYMNIDQLLVDRIEI